MKILIAADHAGFELKNKIKAYLLSEKYDVEDMGAFTMNTEDNYPEIMVPVAMRILKNAENYKAIVFGKSGQGEAMIMNRFPGIRATVYYSRNLDSIRLSRQHNDSNVLSIGAGLLNEDESKEAIKLWLSTPFSVEERHIRRIEQMDNIQ